METYYVHLINIKVEAPSVTEAAEIGIKGIRTGGIKVEVIVTEEEADVVVEKGDEWDVSVKKEE